MTTELATKIWASKYRQSGESNIEDTWVRVANAIAAAEHDSESHTGGFRSILSSNRFLPGGRVIAGAGTGKQVTLFNCFVSGPLLDSVERIFESLKETAVTMQQGGGIGLDFSALRPAGTAAVRTGSMASGPVSFMHIWDLLCQTLLATSTRRGAMMGTLSCDHPDIEKFVDAKRIAGELANFNLSVLITDAFMRAIDNGADWPLVYPPGTDQVYSRIPARDLWQRIVCSAHETAEPGLLFIDTINRENNLHYCERIAATNPCGEVPLPPYGACNLGSLNLTAFVANPFTAQCALDEGRLLDTVRVAVRFMDDVIDVSRFPLDQQAEQARATRRIGLGITGLADALVMLGLHYDSDEARESAAGTMKMIRDAAYSASIELAKEKAAFPRFRKDDFLQSPFVRRLPGRLRDGIADNGIRNSHLLAIAPAGTISLLAHNVSSGAEPIYALRAERAVRASEADVERLDVWDYAYGLWRESRGSTEQLPGVFVTANELPARAHLEMQACLQPFVDGAISKTINLPPDATAADVEKAFRYAWRSGIKGCTVYRRGARSGQVLRALADAHCCDADREAD
ncbi:MAG: adenosylcobalamin-dependent ribonucleoside-diphosphate reductase [Woeseiaceae bacterium]|nr:adenosylcobalamin-dependent ribonucleoside-diphosphate reductase [Woeseiaceae bacterium]